MSSLTPVHRRAWQLAHASPAQIATLVILTQSLLLLIDLASGKAISVSPFQALPVALCAWRLGRTATVLAVLGASGARVADFYLSRQHDGPLMLTYDLLQSACFYGAVAWLMGAMRRLRQRLTGSVARFRRKARQERHSRRLEATIRRALLDDVAEIVRLTVSANDHGAFDATINDPARQAALTQHFRQGILDGSALRDVWGGGSAIAPLEFWVSELDGRLLGYIMVLGLDDRKGPERELHALAVDAACRGLGVGSALVDFFCDRYQHRRRVVACKPLSRMSEMLRRRGFQYHSNILDYDLLVRD